MHKKQERPAARTLLVCTRAKRQFRAKSFSFDSFLCSQRKECLPQLNESNDQIHCLGDDFIRGFLHEGGPPCIGIQHPGLIAQDHAVNFFRPAQSDMERVPFIRVGDGKIIEKKLLQSCGWCGIVKVRKHQTGYFMKHREKIPRERGSDTLSPGDLSAMDWLTASG